MSTPKIYTITYGEYTPIGAWNERSGGMDYKHAANTIAKNVRESDDDEFRRLYLGGGTVWAGPLDAVTFSYGLVRADSETCGPEVAYIGAALRSAIADRLAAWQSIHGAESRP